MFGIGYLITSHTSLCMWLPVHAEIQNQIMLVKGAPAYKNMVGLMSISGTITDFLVLNYLVAWMYINGPLWLFD